MAQLKNLRSIARMIGTVLALAFYLGRLLILNKIRGFSQERSFRFREKFTRTSLRILGVRVEWSGIIPKYPCLLVSNHRSLLDPFIQLSRIRAFIVSKAEVGEYPLFGSGAKATGVIFVQRQNTDSRSAAREAIRSALNSGLSVLIYPEGTTSNEETTQEFRVGSFVIAAEEKIPVVPIALNYADPNDCWHDEPMLAFFIRKFSKRRTMVKIAIGEPVPGKNAEELMMNSREWVNQEIRRLRI